jgi:hypothetical protein
MRWQENRDLGCQQFFSQIRTDVAVIYGTSRTGMHLWVVRKSCGVAERRYCGIGAQLSAGKVTRRGRFANRLGQDIIAGQAKLSFVSRHLRIHLGGMRRRFGGWTSSDRYEP